MAHAVAVRSHAAIYKRRLPPTRHTSGSHRLHQRRCAQSRSRRHEASTKKAHAPPPGCACRSWAPLQCFPRKLPPRQLCHDRSVMRYKSTQERRERPHQRRESELRRARSRHGENHASRLAREEGGEREGTSTSSTLNQLLSSALRQTCSDGTYLVSR